MFILLWKHKGKWFARTNDGKWRHNPWFGNVGFAAKTYKSMGSAKSAKTRILNNSFFGSSKVEFRIVKLKDKESCSELWERVNRKPVST
jgi:hypothetical protein